MSDFDVYIMNGLTVADGDCLILSTTSNLPVEEAKKVATHLSDWFKEYGKNVEVMVLSGCSGMAKA